MKLFVSGQNHITNETFELTITSQIACEFIQMADDGADEEIDRYLAEMGNRTPKAKVLDAFTWIEFGQEAMEMLRKGNRFAVASNEVTFGISGESYSDANMAVLQQEF